MRIAYIGHSHHTKTKSSAFFIEILESLGDVAFYWDESWKGGPSPDPARIAEQKFDLIVVWQTEHPVPGLVRLHPNVVFAPMYDGCKDLPDAYWRSLKGVKVLSFCAAVHATAQRCGLVSRYVRYYPDPSEFVPVIDRASPRGFFWQRTRAVSWTHIRALVEGTRFSGFTVHRAPDPGHENAFVPPSPEDVGRHSIRETSWFADKSAFVKEVSGCNVNFAPRLAEGIGMSFLEAMAMGQVVVAPDRPTMNEYITDGLNGLLYDPEACAPLDFSSLGTIGARARECAIRGHARWKREIPAVVRFLSLPVATFASSAVAADSDPKPFQGVVHPSRPESPALRCGGRRTEGLFKRDEPSLPLVTVATVCFNAGDALAPTMRSVLSQSYPNIEYIVVDGGSSDGTAERLAGRGGDVDLWISEKDGGAYDAMNKAARLARGRWILFMNAGDAFVSEHAVADALDGAPPDAGFIIGHHFYRSVDGVEHLHKASDFEATWRTLVSGRLTHAWKHGVPCHQSTFTRTSFFADDGFDTSFRVAADHDFMYRMRAKGATFHHCDAIVALYVGGGMSWNNQRRCILEWERTALAHSRDAEAVRRFYRGRMDDLMLSEIAANDWNKARRLAVERPSLAWRAFKRAYAPPATGWRHRILGISVRRIDFRSGSSTRPADIDGVSFSEAWGAWTDSRRVVVPTGPLGGGAIEVRLRVRHVFTNCVGRTVAVEIGGVTREAHVGMKTPFEMRLRFSGFGAADKLVITIPDAGAPKDFGGNDDTRLLGLGLESLTLLIGKR